MNRLMIGVAAIVIAATGRIGMAETPPYLIPNGATAPFGEWTVGAADSFWAQWDSFSTPTGTNAPDEGSFGPAPATVKEMTGSAFLTGGSNIYSFSVATNFDVQLPNYAGKPSSNTTRVVAQIHTLGSPILQSSVLLTYNNGSPVALSPGSSALTFDTAAGAGGAEQVWQHVWDLPYSSANYLMEFGASASSMSLAGLRIDSFTRAVPEPAAAGLAIVAAVAGGLMRRRWRR